MIAAVLKTVEVRASVGSNPTLSAIKDATCSSCHAKQNMLLYVSGCGEIPKLAEGDGLLNR